MSAKPKPPLWRQAFDAVEGRVAGPLEQGVRSDAFNDALSILMRTRRGVQKETERRLRRVLHLVNLPAATDVKRLSEQVAALHREVRSLQRELARQDDGRATQKRTRR